MSSTNILVTNISRAAPLSGSLLGRGLYALQLQPWLEAFGTSQIKVLFLEEVVQVRMHKYGAAVRALGHRV